MANHKSALKRAGQNQVRRMRNRTIRTRVKSVVKEVRQTVVAKPGEIPSEQVKHAQAVIDKAAKKGVLHKRAAARKISRLVKLANTVAS